jgi:hypothetical protein
LQLLLEFGGVGIRINVAQDGLDRGATLRR